MAKITPAAIKARPIIIDKACKRFIFSALPSFWVLAPKLVLATKKTNRHRLEFWGFAPFFIDVYPYYRIFQYSLKRKMPCQPYFRRFEAFEKVSEETKP
jgi:hypothetical protein